MKSSDRLRLFRSINKDLARDMNQVASFLVAESNAAMRPEPKGKEFDTPDYWEWWGAKFAKESPISLNLPKKRGVDPALLAILGKIVKLAKPSETLPSHGYSVGTTADNFKALIKEDLWVHQLAMTSENKVGQLLEEYIASVITKHGWIWCRNATVKATDFVKVKGGVFYALQIKNADNTENSSSKPIRDGKKIDEWHRLAKKRTVAEWDKFPDEKVRDLLSEKAFLAYVSTYIDGIDLK